MFSERTWTYNYIGRTNYMRLFLVIIAYMLIFSSCRQRKVICGKVIWGTKKGSSMALL